MAKFSDMLSSAGFDAATAQVAMSGGTPPAPREEPAPAKGQYSFMADSVASGLTEETRRAIDNQEMALFSRRQSYDIADAETFRALGDGRLNSREFEQRMARIDNEAMDAEFGLPGNEASLMRTQTAAARVVDAVAEISNRMGVERPQVDIPSAMGSSVLGGRESNSEGETRRIVRFSRQSIEALDDAGLRFVAAHETYHSADPNFVVGRAAELRADAAAIRATCDIPAAREAITTLARMGQFPLTQTATHPSLEARISNMVEVYNSDCKAPVATPGTEDGRISARDRD